MTTPRRPATWGEIRQFLHIDGWTKGRSTGQEFWEKVLPDESLLQTHVSFGAASDSMGQDRFALILRTQLKVSRADFWRVVSSGRPAGRPSIPPEPAPDVKPAWVVQGLLARGTTQQKIDRLSPAEAEQLLRKLWTQADT